MAYSIFAFADVRERRATKRTACAVAIEARQERCFAVPAELTDLAPRGARISGAGPFVAGAAMTLHLPGGAPRTCRVVWSHGEHSGVCFSAALDATDHAALLRGGAHLRLIAAH